MPRSPLRPLRAQTKRRPHNLHQHNLNQHNWHQRKQPGASGFALPIAVGGAMVLLLSSGSLHLLAVQNRVQAAQVQSRLQLEDTLASAAQTTAAALQDGGGCLLAVDLEAWPQAAAACGLGPGQLQSLQQGQLGAQAYRVAAYRVSSTAGPSPTAELELQLVGTRPWRATYRLGLVAEPTGGWRLAGLQELGLRGARA